MNGSKWNMDMDIECWIIYHSRGETKVNMHLLSGVCAWACPKCCLFCRSAHVSGLKWQITISIAKVACFKKISSIKHFTLSKAWVYVWEALWVLEWECWKNQEYVTWLEIKHQGFAALSTEHSKQGRNRSALTLIEPLLCRWRQSDQQCESKHIKKDTFTMTVYMLTCDITTSRITQILSQYITKKHLRALLSF